MCRKFSWSFNTASPDPLHHAVLVVAMTHLQTTRTSRKIAYGVHTQIPSFEAAKALAAITERAKALKVVGQSGGVCGNDVGNGGR